MTDTNCDKNYNKIFENNSLELDRQMLTINKLDIYLNSESFSKTDYRDRIADFFKIMLLLMVLTTMAKII